MGGVLASIKNHLKIMLPPILRYVYGSCGSDITHAPNTISPNHFTTSLTEHIRQRNTIIRRLHDIKTQHFKVIDFLGTFSSTSANFCIKGNALKLHTHGDNVHLTKTGYKLGADTIIAEAMMLRERQAPQSKPSSNSAGGNGTQSWVWGSFFCTFGYSKSASAHVKLHRSLRQDGLPRNR